VQKERRKKKMLRMKGERNVARVARQSKRGKRATMDKRRKVEGSGERLGVGTGDIPKGGGPGKGEVLGA